MSRVKGVHQLDSVVGSRGEYLLLLSDRLGTVEVVLNRNDGLRLYKDSRVGVGNPGGQPVSVGNLWLVWCGLDVLDGEVAVLRLMARPCNSVHRVANYRMGQHLHKLRSTTPEAVLLTPPQVRASRSENREVSRDRGGEGGDGRSDSEARRDHRECSKDEQKRQTRKRR